MNKSIGIIVGIIVVAVIICQHTFVQVDKDGTLIKKWSGSPTLAALIAEVK